FAVIRQVLHEGMAQRDVVILRMMLAGDKTLQGRKRDFAFARLVGLFDPKLQRGRADPVLAHIAPERRADALALGAVESGYGLRRFHPAFRPYPSPMTRP